MDIKDENENKNNHENTSDHEPTSNDIPLWLQGLEARDPDETKPISPDKGGAASWIREIEAPGIDQSPDENADAERHDVAAEATSEAKIQGDITIEDITEHQMTEISLDHDQGQHRDHLETEEAQSPESELTIAENAPHAGFVDISAMDISEPTGQEEVHLDDEPLREGDLPEWLQEMIAETEEEAPSDAGFTEVKAPEEVEEFPLEDHEIADTEEEPPGDAGFIELKAPDEGVEYFFEDVELTVVEEVVQEISAVEGMPVPEPELQVEADADSSAIVADEEISPLEIAFEKEAISAPLKEEPQAEAESSVEQRPLLELAKEHINQGAIDEAVPLLRELLDEPDNLESLKVWLDEISESETAQNSDLMEIIGDVAMIQNKPDDAFDAYAKAIGILLNSGEVFDEIS